jgi:homoserine kinase
VCIVPPVQRATAWAPGCIGNLGPGLDVLGLAVTGAGDTVTAERSDDGAIRILETGHPDLPSEPGRHAAGLAAMAVLRQVAGSGIGVALRVTKGLPLAGGQGGSAASAAAAAGAVNALFGSPLTREELVEAALESETALAGRHADNVAAAILGGLVLVRSLDPLDLIQLPVPAGLQIVLVHPRMTLETARGRAVLPATVPREIAVHQAAQVGAIVAGALLGDLHLLGRAVDDRLAEPARAPLLPGFSEAKSAALGAGALGCSISGSGPTAFAFAVDEGTAARVAEAMVAAYGARGISATSRVARPDLEGLRVTPE